MRALRLALFSALIGAVCAVRVHADDGPSVCSAERTSFNEYKYNNYYAQDDAASPSDEPPPAPAAASATPAPACTPAAPEAPAATPPCTCVSRWADCHPCFTEKMQDRLQLFGLLDPACCELGKPCLLIDHFPCLKECHKINIAGWVDQSFTWNPQNPANGFNGPVTWTDRSNSYEFNQAYIYVEKLARQQGRRPGVRLPRRLPVRYRLSLQHRIEPGNPLPIPGPEELQQRPLLRSGLPAVLRRSRRPTRSRPRSVTSCRPSDTK